MNRSARASLANAVRSPSDGVLVAAAGEVDRGAGGGQPALDAGGQVEHQVGLGGLPRGVAGVLAAVAGVDDDAPADQVRAALDERGALPQQLRAATGDLAAELAQRAQRGRAAGAVGGQPVVALEGRAGPTSVSGPEDAVDRPGVVAELVQPVLQVDDVVAAGGALGVVAQQPVTERPAGLVERPVGLLADPAVDRQAADLLEVPDGELGGRVELRAPGSVRLRRVAGQQAERARAPPAPRPRRGRCCRVAGRPRRSSLLWSRVAVDPVGSSADCGWSSAASCAPTGSTRTTHEARPSGGRAGLSVRARRAGRPLRGSRPGRQDGALGLGADDALDRLAALEHRHRRDRHDLVVAGDLRVLVDVELGDRQLVARARRRSPRAPGRPSCTGRTTRPRSRRARACRCPARHWRSWRR